MNGLINKERERDHRQKGSGEMRGRKGYLMRGEVWGERSRREYKREILKSHLCELDFLSFSKTTRK